ncbi:MAG: hypothetical protein CMJ58_00480 [Planctomycetaceae bacterium]|nr:hypothetical protein [Planctomycetaceae bacterium]
MSVCKSRCFAIFASLVLGSPAAVHALTLQSHYEFEGNTNNSVPGAPAGTLNGDAALTNIDAAVGTGSLMLDGAGDYLGTTALGVPGSAQLYEGKISLHFKNTNSAQSLGNKQFYGNLNSNDSTAILFGTNGAGGLQMFIRSANNNVYQIRNAIGGNAFNIDTTYADGDWHQIEYEWAIDASGGSGSIKVDGTALETQTVLNSLTTGSPITPWEFDLPLGARNNRGSIDHTWEGLIDDVRVYGIPEPAAVVLALFGAAAGLLVTRRRRTG